MNESLIFIGQRKEGGKVDEDDSDVCSPNYSRQIAWKCLNERNELLGAFFLKSSLITMAMFFARSIRYPTVDRND